MAGMFENEKVDDPSSSDPAIERRVDNSEVPTRKKETGKDYDNGDKIILTEDDCYEELGFCFPTWKKWTILSVIFIVQVSMNFNTSLYSNAITGMTEEFGISAQAARCGAMIFLVLYAFGCELWAPWSEELGRWPVLQLSLFLVNIWQIPVALAKNFGTVMAGRALGGLSSAGGSVTLGMVADMWEPDEQQYAVAFIVFSSVGGSVLGPVVGGFVEQYAQWYFSCLQTRYSSSSNSLQAMEHLDPAHLWWLCSGSSFLPRPRNQNQLHVGQDRQETSQGW
jgi:MFS family permease